MTAAAKLILVILACLASGVVARQRSTPAAADSLVRAIDKIIAGNRAPYMDGDR